KEKIRVIRVVRDQRIREFKVQNSTVTAIAIANSQSSRLNVSTLQRFNESTLQRFNVSTNKRSVTTDHTLM
ncbi:MAG: hypothetical protein IKU98_02970, partial [Bacteroidaceae bacterium]|nr:hypothetical protein [Bacteroidaceae bacterium]